MKIIELLNKIANGEKVPEMIKFDGVEYRLNYANTYVDKNSKYIFQKYNNLILNDELEIIEENPTLNDIRESYGLPRIEEHKIPEKFEIYDNSIEWCCNGRSITDNEKDIMDKINEILDYLEEIK